MIKAVSIAAITVILLSCGKSTKVGEQDPPVPVTVFKVEPKVVRMYETFPGTVTALKEVGLRAQVSGYITGIFFTEGSEVRKGQQLYEIDRRQYDAAYREAANNLKIAQQNLAKIQLDVDRYRTLKDQEAIARQRYDYAMTDLANAKLQVSVAADQLDMAATNLEYSSITAPFAGTIGISQVKAGDLATPGQTLLNTISSDDPMAFDFVIDQSQLEKFREMKDRKPDPADSSFRLVMPDNSVYPANGKIDLIDRAVDPQTGTITVRLIFSNADHILRPGMNCNVRVMNETGLPRIVIPFRAVLEQMGEYFVFLAKDGKVSEVKIALGPRVGSEVIVKEGLKKDDVIAVDGIGKLVDGSSYSLGSPGQKHDKIVKH
jgi:membrane fusion protein, multidrug efflux system